MDSDKAARAAYEAYRESVAGVSPMNGPWEEISDLHKNTWRQVAAAVLAAGND